MLNWADEMSHLRSSARSSGGGMRRRQRCARGEAHEALCGSPLSSMPLHPFSWDTRCSSIRTGAVPPALLLYKGSMANAHCYASRPAFQRTTVQLEKEIKLGSRRLAH